VRGPLAIAEAATLAVLPHGLRTAFQHTRPNPAPLVHLRPPAIPDPPDPSPAHRGRVRIHMLLQCVLVIRESFTKEYGSRVFLSSPCGPLFLHIEPNQLSLVTRTHCTASGEDAAALAGRRQCAIWAGTPAPSSSGSALGAISDPTCRGSSGWIAGHERPRHLAGGRRLTIRHRARRCALQLPAIGGTGTTACAANGPVRRDRIAACGMGGRMQ